jgi:hypothetical protein
MAGLALPRFRWLILGAIAAGSWVVYQDMKAPRPPQKVGHMRAERTQAPAPRPQKPVVAKREAAGPKAATQSAERPVPPAPVGAKPASTAKAGPDKSAPRRTALALPKTVQRPPPKPQQIVTSSINKQNASATQARAAPTASPPKHSFVQTRTRVQLRAQARPDAAVIGTLEPRTVMRELARSGDWRLVMGDGRKGWIRSEQIASPTFLPRRPKLPLAEVKQAKAGKHTGTQAKLTTR